MIEEQFVSFDTARILKEAGFDVPCYVQYSERGVQWNASCPENFNANDWGCSCPTQALAARWLREVHKIHVYAIQTNLPYTEPQTTKWEWGYVIDKVDDPNSDETTCDMYFDSYEAAFEAGLKRGLKLIKSKDYE